MGLVKAIGLCYMGFAERWCTPIFIVPFSFRQTMRIFSKFLLKIGVMWVLGKQDPQSSHFVWSSWKQVT